MGRVLAGMALTTLGTNLWGLNYPLPGIGLVLMLLGFRSCGRRVILIFFHSTARRPATGAEQKNWKFTVYRISHLASHLTRHGAAFGKAAHLAGCRIWQGGPSGRVFHSAGYTIWQDTSLSKAFQPAHTVRKELPIRRWQRYGRTCGRLAAATDCPMRRKRSSGSSTSSGS